MNEAVDHRRTRTCMGLALAGLVNICAYTVAYAIVGGDAWNGEVRNGEYFVKGHFLHSAEGRPTPVSKAVWTYSYVHSITVWPSLAVIVLSLLAVAKPHIQATFRGGRVSGGAVVWFIGAVIVAVAGANTIAFTASFLAEMGE